MMVQYGPDKFYDGAIWTRPWMHLVPAYFVLEPAVDASGPSRGPKRALFILDYLLHSSVLCAAPRASAYFSRHNFHYAWCVAKFTQLVVRSLNDVTTQNHKHH
jgi:hypothetical protein